MTRLQGVASLTFFWILQSGSPSLKQVRAGLKPQQGSMPYKAHSHASLALPLPLGYLTSHFPTRLVNHGFGS